MGKHEQRDLLLRFQEAQPNQGVEWCPVVKHPSRWRLKWAQKLHAYLQKHYADSLGSVSPEMDLLFQGEEVQEQEDEEMKDEGDDVEQNFVASKTFEGARAGFVFKTGARGVGYYRDVKAEKPEVKREKAED